jgi:hypothetical protein
MTNNNSRIIELQQQYFDFCTGIIKKIPPENANLDTLMKKAFTFRDELEKLIIQNEINYKNQAIQEVEKEINFLKTSLDKKTI